MSDQAGFDSAVSVELRTKEGKVYDLNNLSGRAKKELIESGSMTPEKFICPPNMPGKKLKEMRAVYLEKLKAQGYDISAVGISNPTEEKEEVKIKGEKIKIPKKLEENPFREGDHVKYEGQVTEVLKTDPVRGVLIKIVKGKGKKSEIKKIWKHFSQVKKVEAE